MSYGLVTALVTAIATLATVQVLGPVSEPRASLSASKVEGQVTQARANISAIPERSAPLSLETTRPPVPILLTHRSSIASTKQASWDDFVPQDNSVAPPSNLTDEKVAKAAIERDGYKRVRVLNRGPYGIWNARGFRGETEVSVSVDSAGNVSAN